MLYHIKANTRPCRGLFRLLYCDFLKTNKDCRSILPYKQFHDLISTEIDLFQGWQIIDIGCDGRDLTMTYVADKVNHISFYLT